MVPLASALEELAPAEDDRVHGAKNLRLRLFQHGSESKEVHCSDDEQIHIAMRGIRLCRHLAEYKGCINAGL